MEQVGAVLVIGAGVSGMQASLDLAESGFKVYLVERTSSIGGRMAQLDKTFPTNDCAMCTLAPKMVEVARHPDIELLMNSEVLSLDGVSGNFQVTVKKNPSYVKEDKCTGCGLCAEVCPIKIPNEFDMNISAKKAIYVPFPQASPLKYTRDEKYCIDCGLCKIVCEADAIDYEMGVKEVKIDVGSIIVSTGYDLFDPSALEEYGYGKYKNVVSNMQFERLLNASGPTGGHIIRPSDGRDPKKVAFIQCVGSRDTRYYPYCSQICCMASTKEAIIAGEHSKGLESSIFYMDMRAFGKGFQEYANKAEDQYGVKYIRSRPSEIFENLENNNLIIKYDDTYTGEQKEMEADMVVLAAALKPSFGSEELAKILGIELDKYGYFEETSEAMPFETKNEGIFITGACQGPRDVPDSVGQASGAASQSEKLLNEVRGKLIEVVDAPPEKEVSGEPRIGVYICSCGLNIASVVDVKSVTEYAKTLPNVVYAVNSMYTCSDDAQAVIKDAIKEHDLNRIIVASCTPRTHEPLFRATCQEAGLNPYLFEMANIREHVSWVHSNEPEKATEKAKDLVRMAVARSKLLKPQKSREVNVESSATVIGGGIAGLTAAVQIADQGFKVDIIEEKGELGGSVNSMNSVFLDAIDPLELLEPLKKAAADNPNIFVHLNTKVKELTGFSGNFNVIISESGSDASLKSGAIVVATGSQELKPEGKYLYGENQNVMTQGELEEKLKAGPVDYGTIAMIQCVGAREVARPYCSRMCCIEALKNAILLKKKNPESKVLMLFRDMMTFGKYEDYYVKAQEEFGVKFIRYLKDKPPIIEDQGEKLLVTVYDPLLSKNLQLAADKLILSTPQIPSDGVEELQKILKVPRGADGFFMEAHAKLRPLEFPSDGIFLCGSAQSPKELTGIIAQASGAASKVCSLLSKGVIETDAATAVVNEELCIGCGRCIEVCPYDAISLLKNDKGEDKALINDAICKGCGTCASVCPNSSITPRHFEKAQIIAMIDELLEEKDGIRT